MVVSILLGRGPWGEVVKLEKSGAVWNMWGTSASFYLRSTRDIVRSASLRCVSPELTLSGPKGGITGLLLALAIGFLDTRRELKLRHAWAIRLNPHLSRTPEAGK